MIIIIIACVLAFAIVTCVIGCQSRRRRLETFGGYLILPCLVILVPMIIACMFANNGNHISIELYLRAREAQRIIKKYDEAIESDDKRMIVARKAEIAVYNEEIETYKRNSKNPLIGCFYPKEIADNLKCINERD